MGDFHGLLGADQDFAQRWHVDSQDHSDSRLREKTVERVLACNTPPSYSKQAPQKTAFDEVKLDVRALLNEVPDMKATVIAQRVAWQGINGQHSSHLDLKT